jgi:hypothetical protein
VNFLAIAQQKVGEYRPKLYTRSSLLLLLLWGSLGASDRKRKRTTKQNERGTCRLLLVLFSDQLPFLRSSSLSF